MTAAEETTQPGRIVVGVDGSASSKQALLWAEFMAGVSGCTIHAVGAWHEGNAAAAGGMVAIPAQWDPAGDTAAMLRDTLEEVLGADRAAAVETTVGEGSAAKVLLDAANSAHMLIVGSRGHGGFAGLLLGSVSTACAEHADCPVLVIHGTTPPPQLS